MNENFWAIIAQVSATFVGLVFVGQTFHLSSIRDATERLTTSEYGLREKSSKVMIVCVALNLLLFLLPMLISLCLLSVKLGGTLWTWDLFWVFSLPMCFFAIFQFENKYLKSDVMNKETKNSRTRNLLSRRLIFGKNIVLISLALITVLLFLMTLFNLPNIEKYFEFITIFLLLTGLAFSVVDLIAFDLKNVLFQTSEITQKMADAFTEKITMEMTNIDELYNLYQEATESNRYQHWQNVRAQEILKIYPSMSLKDLRRIESQEIEGIKTIYCTLSNTVRHNGQLDFTKTIYSSDILSYDEFVDFKTTCEMIEGKIKAIKVTLNQKISFLQENGILLQEDIENQLIKLK